MGMGTRAASAVASICISVLLIACAIERRGLEPSGGGLAADGGQEDGAAIDAVPPPSDGAVPDDAPLPDGDAGPTGTDAAPTGTDAGPPDAGPPPSCDSLFGPLPGYRLCEERATECEFYTQLDESSCAAACASTGRSCLGAYDDTNPAMACNRSTSMDCSDLAYDLICICSR